MLYFNLPNDAVAHIRFLARKQTFFEPWKLNHQGPRTMSPIFPLESIVSMPAGILKIRLDLLMIKGKFPPAKGVHKRLTRSTIVGEVSRQTKLTRVRRETVQVTYLCHSDIKPRSGFFWFFFSEAPPVRFGLVVEASNPRWCTEKSPAAMPQ